MCGRYFFDPDDYRDFLRQTDLAGRFQGGEICPSMQAPVLTAAHKAELARWGLPFHKPGQNLLHARAETVEEKRSFAPAFRHDRIMVPTSGFFEWQHDEKGRSLAGQKYFFREKGEPRLYLAGLLLPGEEGPCFVIITRPAGVWVEATHDREPLILPRERVNAWLGRIDQARALLRAPYPELQREFRG